MTSDPAYRVKQPKSGEDETVIALEAGARPPTAEELAFYSRASQMHSRIKRLLLHTDRPGVIRYTKGVRSALGVGLENPGNLRTGAAALDAIRESFIEDEGPKIRGTFLQGTLAHSLALFVGSIVVACLMLWQSDALEPMADARDILFDAAWIGAGAAVGIVFFAFVNSLTITFDNVGRFDSTGLGPTYRLFFVAIVLIVLSVLLLTGVLSIGIGTLQLNDFRDSSQIAFLLGLFGAYSDIPATRLISSVLDRAAERRAGGT